MSWPLVKLKDIFEIARGGSPRPIADYITEESDGLNWISIKDASNSEKFITKTKLKIRKEGLKKSRLVKDGDFLLTNSMSFGRPYIMKTTGCIHDGWLVLSSDTKIVNQDYFYHLLGSPFLHSIFSKLAAGAVVKNLNIDLVKGVEIPLPSIEEQKKIAKILDTADSLRQKDLQLVEHYNRLSQSLFLDMFGDSVANLKGWEVKKLKELSTKIHSGNTPKGGSKVYVDKGVTFLRSQNVWKNKVELDDVVFIDKETHNKMSKSSLKYQDILMTKTGRINTENSSLGRAAMFLGEDDTANVNGHVYLIRLKEEVINEFVLFILTSIEYRDYIRSVCVGGIDKRQLNKDHLENFPIISPPRYLQEQFVEQLKLITKQKELVQRRLNKSNDLFNSLLQKAFTGELTGS